MNRVRKKWKPGHPVPDYYSGMPVTFAWNEVALTKLLCALRDQYPSGYASMVGHVQEAMESFTPPTPPIAEPTGLGAVVEDDRGFAWVRTHATGYPWHANLDPADRNSTAVRKWRDINATRVLSEGIQ